MAKANISRQALIEAITSLESQRNPTGVDQEFERAVRIALQALREKLAEWPTQPGTEQTPHPAVLVADLSGFTALSERMDAERVRDALNAMWQVLDEVVVAWGGRIDQHAGDSLLALFGLSRPRRNDVARALQAALAMQMELQLFNQRVRQARESDAEIDWMRDWTSPLMRIGVHSGPVYFVRSPGSGRQTAVGDTILMARHLEKQAPAGQVLTSATVYRQTYPQFRMEPIPTAGGTFTSPVTGRLVGEEAYLVLSERPEMRHLSGSVAGQVARLVGRTTELDELQLALQMAIDSRRPQLVLITGEPGAGKSRLLYEFESQARLADESLTSLHAGVQQAWIAPPYSLIRDLLLRRLNIRSQHSRHVIEAKLQQALVHIQTNKPIDRNSKPDVEVANLLLNLLDIQSAGLLEKHELLPLVVQLMETITATGPAVLFLHQVHQADRQSLDLIDQLLLIERDLPILFICLAETRSQTDDPAIIPWLESEDDPFSPATRFELKPLSPVELRLLSMDWLSRLSPVPMRLVDLIVAESRGNPLYIAEFIRLLIDRGHLIQGDPWRVDMARVESMRLPAGIQEMIRARLDHLTKHELQVLQHAAVMGFVFWDAAMLAPVETIDETLSETDIDVALHGLVNKQYIIEDITCSFADNQAFAFIRPVVREVVYDLIPETERPRLHRRMADWLITISEDTQSGGWLPIDAMVAWHFSRAGDSDRAASGQQRQERVARP